MKWRCRARFTRLLPPLSAFTLISPLCQARILTHRLYQQVAAVLLSLNSLSTCRTIAPAHRGQIGSLSSASPYYLPPWVQQIGSIRPSATVFTVLGLSRHSLTGQMRANLLPTCQARYSAPLSRSRSLSATTSAGRAWSGLALAPIVRGRCRVARAVRRGSLARISRWTEDRATELLILVRECSE